MLAGRELEARHRHERLGVVQYLLCGGEGGIGLCTPNLVGPDGRTPLMLVAQGATLDEGGVTSEAGQAARI